MWHYKQMAVNQHTAILPSDSNAFGARKGRSFSHLLVTLDIQIHTLSERSSIEGQE
jgi:hypothetical protein